MSDRQQFVKVEFKKFKAFKSFTLQLRRYNILVGPNNAGKSTILAAFRILAAAMRKAEARKAEVLRGPNGNVHGHSVDLSSISVAEENIFYNYDDSEPATVIFHLTNKTTLTIWFPEPGTCILLMDALGKPVSTPSSFKANFNCTIGFVPILGPVEHHEPLYEKEAARLALYNYRAARNFRNIWYHYPEKFAKFREALCQTWPGMDVEPPEVDRTHQKPLLHMYCPEDRMPREIFWSGFGFQVWCQMLTHLIQNDHVSLFLIDEPDIYLHSELQRQLLGLLRRLGPDILIATHSTEIITEAETDDIVVINKKSPNSRRIKDPSKIGDVFELLGSSINPILTQLAKTRRVLFVEGQDFQIIGKFARRVGAQKVGNRSDFAVVSVGGFSPDRMRDLKLGMEKTLGMDILAAAILDRDYRSLSECSKIETDCRQFCQYVNIHSCKEIENFLLNPASLDRAAHEKVVDRNRRANGTTIFVPFAHEFLDAFANSKRNYVTAQIQAERKRFERIISSGLNETTINEIVLDEVNALWELQKLSLVPGKDTLTAFNTKLQEIYSVNVSPSSIIDAMHLSEIPPEITRIVEMLNLLSARAIPE